MILGVHLTSILINDLFYVMYMSFFRTLRRRQSVISYKLPYIVVLLMFVDLF
jgi:hypothetical protein